MSERSLSDYQQKGLIKAASIIQACLMSEFEQELPAELLPFGNVPNWQKQAASRLTSISFKAFSPAYIEGRMKIEVIGYIQGIFEYINKALEKSELVEGDFEGIYLEMPQAEQGMTEEQFERFLDALPPEIRAKYHASFAQGLRALSPVDNEILSSDAQELYLLALIYSDDLGYLDDWNSLHRFVCDFIPQYTNRKDSMRKNLNRVGFRLGTDK